MYKIRLATLFLFTSISLSAQDLPDETPPEDPWENFKMKQFTIDLDSTVFRKESPVSYVSDLYENAMVFVMVAEDTTEASSAMFEAMEPGKKYPVENDDQAVQERFITNGRDYIRRSRLLETESGSKMIYLYSVADGPYITLIMSAYCRKQDDEVLAPFFEKAAQSLRYVR
jgi:hypothetical protein